jgi:hypothetical protein
MWRRPTAATVSTSGATSARNAANQRSARSLPLTLPGRSVHPIWLRERRHGGHQHRPLEDQLLPARQQQRPAHRVLAEAGHGSRMLGEDLRVDRLRGAPVPGAEHVCDHDRHDHQRHDSQAVRG